MSKLPFVTSDIPRDLRAFVDRVREAFNGKGRDKLITLGDLVDGGVTNNDGDVIPIIPGGEYATPPAPTGVTAVGGLANILVSWDNPTYYGHSYAEVWGASTNNLGAAVLLGMAPGSTFSDAIGSGATRYYWVRFVNVVDVVGPYNATAGTVGQTAYDPAYLLQVLNNSITTSELSTALNTTISTNTTQITNIRNLYMVKMDNNGFLSGYGLMSTLSEGGVATSDFFINANRFAVTAPMGSMPLWSSGTSYVRNAAVRISGNNSKLLICQIAGTSGGSTPSIAGDIGTTVTDGSVTWQIASSVPLAVLTTSAILNGQTLAPGVYMDGAYIVNATIGGAKIRQAEIDIANITGSLTANRITAGSISTGEYIQSTSYIAGTQGWRINGNGSADFQNVTVRGTVYATDGEFLGTVKAGTTILGGSAVSYGSGTGLYAGLNGSTYTFRVGNPSGARLQWDGSSIAVYDSGGSLTFSSGGVPWSSLTGTVPSSVANSSITLSSSGTLSGAGGGTVTLTGLGGKAFAFLDTITAANISTYIASAAIGEAYIANGAITNAKIGTAAITSAKIGDAEVSTLKIAGNAVTVPEQNSWSGFITGSGSYINVVTSPTITAPAGIPIKVVGLFAGRVGYTGSPVNTAYRVMKNGSLLIDYGSVGAFLDFPSFQFYDEIGAGSSAYYTIQWYGASSGASIGYANVVVLGTKR